MSRKWFLVKAGGCIVLSVILGCVLLFLAYMLPTDRIRENIARTSEMLQTEGSYYQWAEGYKNAQADNYSDASLYLNAMYAGSGNIVQDAMNAPRRLYGDDNNEDSVVLTANNQEEGPEAHDVNYGRYWHGSLILLKPLLLFFDLADIRFFNMMIHLGLLFVIVAGFTKRSLTKYLPSFFLAVIMINPVSAVMCYCYSVEYTIMLSGMALMLCFHDVLMREWNYYFYFLWLGIITVYFNELCFPMVIFGIPMTLYLLLSSESGWALIRKEAAFGACWGAGYSLVWMGKWICAWIFTGYNYFMEALGQASRYTSDHATWEAENPGLLERIWKNVNVYVKWPFVIAALVVLAIAVFYLIKAKRRSCRENILRMLPYFLMVLFPFGIYTVLGNGYSFVHYWFTHRLLAISAFAGVCMLLQAGNDVKRVSRAPENAA